MSSPSGSSTTAPSPPRIAAACEVERLDQLAGAAGDRGLGGDDAADALVLLTRETLKHLAR
jgi:hypothetical protein